MQARDKKLNEIIDWSKENNDIRVVLLTSSLVNPLAPVDDFSDIDIELVFEDNSPYVLDNNWINKFGIPVALFEEDETSFGGSHAMKMVLYEDHVKVDFKLYSKSNFISDMHNESQCVDWDIGYEVLIDKDILTKELKKPTYRVSIIRKPTEATFSKLIADFWWDTTYVAKCLARGDIFYAKFMSEDNIRTNYIVPLIEWHIASQHNWEITTNKHGRLFKKYLDAATWLKIEKTFSGSNVEDNWNALFAFADLVHELGTGLSQKLGYAYPEKSEVKIRTYLNEVKAISDKQ